MSEKLKKIIIEASLAVLLSAYPVSYLYQVNYDKLLFKQTILPFIIIGGIAFLSFLFFKSLSVFKFSIRNLYIVIPLLCILLFTYGHIFSILSQMPYLTGLIKNRYLLPLYLILSLVVIYLVHSIQNRTATGLVLNFLIFLNLTPFGIISLEYLRQSINKQNQQKLNPIKTVAAQDNDPDIYYIVLDMYPSNEVLKKYWSFDNTTFVNKLKELGFQVFNESQSNYPITYLALNSVLNLQYIHKKNGAKLTGLTKAYLDETLLKNQASIYLKNRGYNYYVFEGGIFPEPINKSSQDFFLKVENRTNTINYQTSPDNDFFLLFINSSIIFPFADKIQSISSKIYRKRIYYTLDRLPLLSRQIDKKFVIAHIMCPHSPYIFGQGGEEVFVDDKSPMRRMAFLNQLKFINKKIVPVLNQLINNKNGRSKIIILQGDHGTREIPPNGNYNMDEDWAKAYYGNFNAIYSSDIKADFSRYTSPVNTFRRLFNSEFDENFTLLPDKKFYTDYIYPLSFVEIAESKTYN